MRRPWQNKIFIFFTLIAICLIPVHSVFSSGYQEEKLFDSDFYTAEELRQMVEGHTREIKVLDDQIRQLEIDIDWLVLKINKIRDSGRIAPASLKDSISAKEKKIVNLRKTRNRLEYLVQYYSAILDSGDNQTIDGILKNKLGSARPVDETPAMKTARTKQAPIRMVVSRPKTDTNLPDAAYSTIRKEDLESAVTKAGLSDWVEIVGDGTCLKLETTLPILFPTGSAEVAEEYKSFFKKLAAFLKPYDVKVLVNGYADKVPINNEKYPSNFELGATRAANIIHEFVGFGLKPSIFKIETTGKYRFASKQMSSQKSLERRAEVTVIFSG